MFAFCVEKQGAKKVVLIPLPWLWSWPLEVCAVYYIKSVFNAIDQVFGSYK